MKRMFGLVMMMGLVVSVVRFTGCGGDSDSPTGPSEITKGPQGQTLEVETEKWDNGNIKVEFQFYRDGGSVVKHGWYKGYDEDGTLRVDGTYFEGKSDDVNPFTSGEWRDSSECGGYSEEEVSEFWNEDAILQEIEGEIGNDESAARLDCQAWLERNK